MENSKNLYLLTGFLGAGKTSFLKKLMANLENKKIGIIMNEFGKVSIDGQRLAGEGLNMIELNRGSIFCSCLQLSFVSALVEMAEMDLDYIFVESSGLADPSNIGEFLEAVEVIKPRAYNYKGTITIVDGLNFLDQVSEIETISRQVKFADMAYISKKDLIDPKKIGLIKDKLKKINPEIFILNLDGKDEFTFLKDNSLELKPKLWEETTNREENKPKTLTLTFYDKTSKENLELFIREIMDMAYRLKGYVNMADGTYSVDLVNKKIDYKLESLDREESELVIISKVGNDIIRPIFKAWEEKVGIGMKLR